MRPILLPAILAFASVIFGADAELEAALAKV
jgi:hypothetical protein